MLEDVKARRVVVVDGKQRGRDGIKEEQTRSGRI